MMKYLRHRDFGFILFEGKHRHDVMLKTLGWDVKDIAGAGFVFHASYLDVPACYGESVMLRIKAGNDDTQDLSEHWD